MQSHIKFKGESRSEVSLSQTQEDQGRFSGLDLEFEGDVNLDLREASSVSAPPISEKSGIIENRAQLGYRKFAENMASENLKSHHHISYSVHWLYTPCGA